MLGVIDDSDIVGKAGFLARQGLKTWQDTAYSVTRYGVCQLESSYRI